MYNHYTTKIILLTCIIFLAIVSIVNFRSVSVPDVMAVDSQIGQYTDRVIPAREQQQVTQSMIQPATQSVFKNIVQAFTPDSEGCKVVLDIAGNPSSGFIDYDVTVKNTGAQTCESTTLTLYYGDDESYVSSSIKSTASGYYWSVGQLASGQAFQLTIKTSSPNSTLTSEACATATNGSDDCKTPRVGAIATTVPSQSQNRFTSPTPMPTPTPSPKSTPTSASSREFGTWVWDAPDQLSVQQMTDIVSKASINNFNVIYITIDSYLDIYNLPEGSDKDTKKNAYDQALGRFVSLAQQKNIAVDAEAGWRDWSEPAGRSKSYAILDYVEAYNLSHPNLRLRCLQYDVEPYLLSTYNKNKAQVLRNYVEWADEIAMRSQGKTFALTLVIPHFYDSTQAWTPMITFKNYKDYTFNHLLRSLSRLSRSTIIIMAYRDFAAGNNGTIQISQKEVLDANAYPTQIIVAQETGNVEPDYVTFFGQSRADLFREVDLVNPAFAGDRSFAGIAIHYLDPFLELE